MPYSPEYLKAQLAGGVAAPEKPQDKAVFMPAMRRSAGGMVRGAGHLASALGAESLGKGMQEYGAGVEERNPAQFSGMAGLAESPWGFAKETFGELVPTALGMAIPGGLIGKGLTKAVPAIFGQGAKAQLLAPGVVPGLKRGLQITGPGAAMGLGMGAGSTALETGEILGQQMDETGQYNMGRALPFGMAAGALDASMGVGGVIRKGLTGQLGRNAAEKVGLGVIGKQALKTAGAEGSQEGVQTGLEMEGVKEGGFTEKASTAHGVDELLTSIVKGFIGGGAFGTAQGGKQYLERKSVESEVKAQLAESQKQENEAKAKAAAQQETQATAAAGAAQIAAKTQEEARRARMKQIAAESDALIAANNPQAPIVNENSWAPDPTGTQAYQDAQANQPEPASAGLSELVQGFEPYRSPDVIAEEYRIAGTVPPPAIPSERQQRPFQQQGLAASESAAPVAALAPEVEAFRKQLISEAGSQQAAAEHLGNLYTKANDAYNRAPTEEARRRSGMLRDGLRRALEAVVGTQSTDFALETSPASNSLRIDLPETATVTPDTQTIPMFGPQGGATKAARVGTKPADFAKRLAGDVEVLKTYIPDGVAYSGFMRQAVEAAAQQSTVESQARTLAEYAGKVGADNTQGVVLRDMAIRLQMQAHEDGQAIRAEREAQRQAQVQAQDQELKQAQQARGVAAAPVPKSVKQVKPSPEAKPNEKAPAPDQSVDAAPAAQEAPGTGPANASTPGTEIKRPAAQKAAGNGSSTNEKVATNGLQTETPGTQKPAGQKPAAEKPVPAEVRNAKTEETVTGGFPAAPKLKGEAALKYAKWAAQFKKSGLLTPAVDYASVDGKQGSAIPGAKEKIVTGTGLLEHIGSLLSAGVHERTIKGKKFDDTLFGLASEAIAIPAEGRVATYSKVATEVLDYVRKTNPEAVARAEKAAVKAQATTLEVINQQEAAEKAKDTAAKAKVGPPVLGAEERQNSTPKITIYKNGKPQKTVTEAEYKASKQQEKKAKKRLVEDQDGEVPTIEPDPFENTAESFADAIYDGRLFHRSSHPMPNQKVYDKAVKAGDLAGIQTLIRSHFKTNKAMQRILDWVESSVGDVKIVHVNEDMTDDYGHYVGAEYDPATHTITVYQGGSNPVVLAHELVHAAMERQLQEVANYKGPKTEAMARKLKAYNELKAQYEKFKTAMPNSEAYGLTNLSEFMAEVFSNVDFRAALQTQPKTSFWRGLIRSIANFLGFKKTEQNALEDIFSAAQVLAYRNPGEVFMPTAWKTVYSVADTMPSITRYVNEAYDNKTKLEIWGEQGKGVLSQAKAKLQNALFGLSTGHNLDEMFGWIPGVRDIFTTQDAQESMAKKLQDHLASKTEQFLKWEMKSKQESKHLWSGLTHASVFRLSMDQVEKVATGKEDFKTLLDKQKALPKDQKLDGTNLQDTPESRKQFDAMKSHLQAIGWGKKPTRTEKAKDPANVLPDDATTWSAQEWGEWFIRENRKTAQRLYESSLLNVVARLYKGNDQVLEKLYKPNTTFQDIEKMYEAANNKTPRDADYVSNIKRMRDQAMSHVYVHVHRKGDYFVSLIKPKASAAESDRVEDFMRFESEYEAKQVAEAMQKEQQVKDAGYVIAYGQTSDFTQESAVGGMMQLADQMNAHLEAMKEVSGMDQKHIDMTKDIIRQTLYDMMPENSIMKSYLHRKGTPGWKPEEQFQGFVQHQIRSNFHYANNRFLGKYDIGFSKIKDAIKDMEEPHRLDGMKTLAKNGDKTYDEYLSKIAKGNPVIAKKLLNELLVRHTGNFVTMETPIADRWRSATYAWQLGLSPGYLLANLMQPIQLGLPTLGGRYGWKNSTKALMDGYRVAADVMGIMAADGGFWKPRTTDDVIKALEGKFEGRTLKALRHLLDSGKVDYTLAKEAGMLAEGQSLAATMISRVVSSGAHYSEMLNRVASGMAAYELENARSGSQEKSENAAVWAVDQTQFDYNRMNQSRFLGRNSPLGRYTPLLTVFMSYNIQLMELYARNFRTAIMSSKDFPGTPAEAAAAKKEAWNTLTGMFATTFTLAGAMGLPFSSLIYALAGQMGGDDDEPLDVPLAMRAWTTTAFGSDGGLAVTEGLPALFGVNMSQRLGQHDIVPYSRFLTDHRTLAEMPAEVLTKNISAPISTLMSWSTGLSAAYKYMMDGASGGGDAMIKALPAALRGAGTAIYGYHDAAGQELPREVTAWQTAMQILGIAPQFRNDQMMLLMADKSKEATLAKRAAYIRSNLAHYTREGDQEMIERFREKSQAFIESNPRFAERMSIAPLLKKMDSNRAFYQMTGMGSVVPQNRLEEVYGLAQMLDLPEDEE
jgi:hypothetical protein